MQHERHAVAANQSTFCAVIWKFLKDHWDGKTWERRDNILPQVKQALAKAFLELVLSKLSSNRIAEIRPI